MTMGDELFIRPEAPKSAAGQAILQAYFAEVVGRFHGRNLRPHELDAAVSEFPSDDLAPPHGVLLVAWLADQPIGCAGLRRQDDKTGTVSRVFVSPSHRRRGVGRLLMESLERHARQHGLRRLRLDTRHDLAEARALYAAIGFHEVAAFNDEPYAEHWFQRDLG
jgi:GNAT superfamily N-acetyltransferase